MERRKDFFRGKVAPCVFATALAFFGRGLAQEESGPGEAPDDTAVVAPSLTEGDMNADGDVNVTDVIRLVNWLYQGGPEPIANSCTSFDLDSETAATAEGFAPSHHAADINGDGVLNITDVIRLVNWLYLGGAPPASVSCQQVIDFSVYKPTPGATS